MSMNAIAINKYGDVDVLEKLTLPKPTPLPRDLIVQIKAASINPVDMKVRGGSKGSTASNRILGYDGSGIVTEVGSEVKNFKVGDEVYFAGVINRNGTNAEYTAVDERIVGRKPKKLSWEEAAAIPLTILTAWEGLIEGMGATPRDQPEAKPKTLLVIAGAGGVGSAVIELAKKILKLTVIATASRPESIDYCKKFGADHVINHKNDLKEELKKIGFEGVDYVFNCADADQYFDSAVAVINPLGKVCFITEAKQPHNIAPLMSKRGSLVYEFMFSRALYGNEPEKQGEILNKVADLLDSGVFQSRLTKTYNLWNDIKQAHKDVESGSLIGKVALTL
eukprot:TRINITY_DN6480_c0_g1_i1.p1 TRINITY_DN6480_c0_g1~~TRINITY_DN6480_c0_g1_i1.p1  ORF type:complete len:336 (+),score=89.68 TRINITY_DN6480_c0_g1_i1:30-1037(+)